MGILVIARIYDNNNFLGYRLFDEESEQVRDVCEASLKSVMSTGYKLNNVELRGTELHGTNGSLERYARINVSNFENIQMPLVVLGRLNGGYSVVDCCGNIKNVRETELIRYADKFGLANGKIVEKDSKKFISAIYGEYKEVKASRKMRYVVLGYVHGVSDISKCVTCTYFDLITNKAYGRTLMEREFEKLGYEEDECMPRIVRTNTGYKEVHEEVYPIRNDCVIKNKSRGVDWWYKEVVIGLIRPGYYLCAHRRSGKNKEYSLYDILKLKNDGYELVCDIEYTDDSIIVQSATDIYRYPKEHTLNILENHNKNVDRTKQKLKLLGDNDLEIDSIGRLISVNAPAGSELIIPDCVNEIEKRAFSYNNSYYTLLRVGDNIKKVNYNCCVTDLKVDKVETQSLELLKAIARKKSEFKVTDLYYTGAKVRDDMLLNLLYNVRGKININGIDTIDRELAIKILDRAFKKENLKKYLDGGYKLEETRFDLIDINKKPVMRDYIKPRFIGRAIGRANELAELKYTSTYQEGVIGERVGKLMKLIGKVEGCCSEKGIGQKYLDILDKLLEMLKDKDKRFMDNLKLNFKDKYVYYNCKSSIKASDGEERKKHVTVYKYVECTDNIGNNFLVKIGRREELRSKQFGTTNELNPFAMRSIIYIGSDLHNKMSKYINTHYTTMT